MTFVQASETIQLYPTTDRKVENYLSVYEKPHREG